MNKTMILSALALSLSLFGCANDPAQDNTALRAAVAASDVSLRESVSIAEGSLEGSVATSATLLARSNVLTVHAFAAEVFQDVRIDSVSGDVVSTKALEGGDEICSDSVSLSAAIAAAEEAVGGDAVVIQPDDDGECNREVKVLDADDVLWEVKVAPNGTVIEEEIADDAEETDG